MTDARPPGADEATFIAGRPADARPPTGCGWPSCTCAPGSAAATRCWRVGRPDAAVTDLQHLVAEHPLRERLWARLVTALYAADRQAEALEACRRCAELLRDELGIDPGPELRDLEQAVLRQDPTLLDRIPRPRAAGDARARGAAAARPGAERWWAAAPSSPPAGGRRAGDAPAGPPSSSSRARPASARPGWPRPRPRPAGRPAGGRPGAAAPTTPAPRRCGRGRRPSSSSARRS